MTQEHSATPDEPMYATIKFEEYLSLRSERDHYKALCEELRGAFGPLMEVLTDEGWIMRRSEIAEKYLAANAALAKSKELP